MVKHALYLVPLLPLAAFVINIFLGRLLKEKAAWVSIAASAAACALALSPIYQVTQGAHLHHEFLWLTLGRYALEFGYLLDPLAATLLFVVTVVGTLIQVYASGYMHGDIRFSRFFAYVSLFMSAMLTLVIANNFLMFFISWEIMGLCSYLLIGFWFEKDSAANAGRKAFLTTRVGDVGFFFGILTLFTATGTLAFGELHDAVHHAALPGLLPMAALFIFCGTIGKSAQFPLHVWLPDAMEGPTPVSALIHAATMVAAGVYLIARSFPLFETLPQALSVVAWIGTITAMMAAFFALTAIDIKKVLAYSTISQLGYMVAALGLGGLAAGTFHLMTHAFFKALLFMGAGSVIHGTGTQDIRELGGLFGKMKHTSWTFLIAAIAIAGVPPFAGFWSKDEILLEAWKNNGVIFVLLLITALMTAFYMFRLVFLTFFGKARNHEIHPHESPASMTAPLWVLAVGSILLGLPGSPFFGNWFQHFLHHGHGEAHVINWAVIVLSLLSALGGIGLAALMYLKTPALAEKAGSIFRPLYTASQNKFWFDEIYSALLIRPFHKLGALLFGFDKTVVDGAVNGTGWTTVKAGVIHRWIDQYIVDGLVNFTGALTRFFSAVLRRIQTGFVQNYLLFAFLGFLVLIYCELKKF